MKKFSAVIFGVILSLALVARVGTVMSMEGHGLMAGTDCSDGFCDSAHQAESDCIAHCLAAGLVRPMDGVAPSLLLLAVAAAILVPLMSGRISAASPTARGGPAHIGKMLMNERIATDILRN